MKRESDLKLTKHEIVFKISFCCYMLSAFLHVFTHLVLLVVYVWHDS